MRIAGAVRIAGLPEAAIRVGITPRPGSVRSVEVRESQLRIVSRTGKWSLSRGQFLLLGVITRDHEVVAIGRQIPDSVGEISVVRRAARMLRVRVVDVHFTALEILLGDEVD